MNTNSIFDLHLSKKLKWTIGIVGAVVLLLHIIEFFALTLGAVTTSVHSFAVDSQGRVYVAANNGFYLYKDGKLLDTYDIGIWDKGYVVEISDQKTLIVVSGTGDEYESDSDGNLIKTKTGHNRKVYNAIHDKCLEGLEKNGNTYKLTSSWGRTQIVRDGTVVEYELDSLSYAFKISKPAMTVVFFGFIITVTVIYLSKQRKMKKSKTGDSFAS